MLYVIEIICAGGDDRRGQRRAPAAEAVASDASSGSSAARLKAEEILRSRARTLPMRLQMQLVSGKVWWGNVEQLGRMLPPWSPHREAARLGTSYVSEGATLAGLLIQGLLLVAVLLASGAAGAAGAA